MYKIRHHLIGDKLFFTFSRRAKGLCYNRVFYIGIWVICNLSFADTIFGIDIGVQTWLYNNSGDLIANNENYNALEEIDLNSENSNSIFIAVEHGVPFLPNFKLQHTNFTTKDFVPQETCPPVFPNICFPKTQIDLSHTNMTFYYEILDNWLNLDLGLSAIYFGGEVDFDTGLDADVNFSKIVPAVYAKAMFEFPITDFSASLTANIGKFTTNSIIDYELAAQYKIGLGFNVEAGLRQQTIDFGNDGVDVSSDATGVFAGLNLHF
ncbi:MAG: TIGR04219 family outer membrane beta-barrel protein [Proteobacteria bacterium]|nr:TIGR04219 family outer membrane beta-barrel protein [Pseudomonadota bacterium]